MSMNVDCDLFCTFFFGCPKKIERYQWEYDDAPLTEYDCGASVSLDMTTPSEATNASFVTFEGDKFNSQQVELGEDLSSKHPSNQLSTPQLFDGESSFGSSRASLSGSMRVYGRSDEDEASDRHQEDSATHHVGGATMGAEEPRLPALKLSASPASQDHAPSVRDISLAQLVALGLVPPHPRISAPAYPAHLPHVRCCYDSNKMKECERHSNCYHLHCDGADRCRPAGLKPHEVYVPRPHFIAYNEVQSVSVASLPCNYGLNCKNHQHRRCAVKHKFNATALVEYEAYVRAFRSYEFAVIQYYLVVGRVRRHLTDEDVRDAQENARRNKAPAAPCDRKLLW